MNWRYAVLLAVVAAVCLALLFIPPIPQSEDYHNFADQRALLGIPHCLDTLSNLFFLVAGGLGIRFAAKNAGAHGGAAFLDSRERWPYLVFFVGVALTAFGSAYYHLEPTDSRLLWDRLPMSAAFAALLAATIAERNSVRAGLGWLAPLLVFGAGSVLYWNYTQSLGRGDLRPYVLTQFGFLLVLVLLVALFPARYTRTMDLVGALGFYVLAKILEAADRPIFALGHIVSGHTLKHIAAAICAYWILRMLRLRAPIAAKAALA